MILRTLVVGPIQANCYIVGCEKTREAIVIDPGDNAPRIEDVLARESLHLNRVLATHAHFDHILAARQLCQSTGAPFYMHPSDRPELEVMKETAMSWLGRADSDPPVVSGELLHGVLIELGEIQLEVRHTPGHSPGGIALVDHLHRRVFSGDTLFAGSIGRTDLSGGDFQQLLASIRQQLLTLPDDYAVLPGHGPTSTVGEERAENPFLTEDGPSFWQ